MDRARGIESWVDQPIDEWVDEWVDEWMEECMEGWLKLEEYIYEWINL